MKSARSVKPIFDFSSGVLKMPWIAPTGFASAMLLLDAAARRLDRGASRGAHLHAAHGERARHFPVREELRRPLRRADQPRLRERLARDLRTLRQLAEIAEPHDLMVHPERIREPALR